MQISLIRTTSENADFRSLVKDLDEFLAEIDGADHAYYAQFNKTASLRHAVVAMYGGRYDDHLAGCGAFKEVAPGVVEIKRMYVPPRLRRLGVAQAVLAELECWATELGYAACVLETGKRQPEAIALYHRCGYLVTSNYGQYVGVENSVCMRKDLQGRA